MMDYSQHSPSGVPHDPTKTFKPDQAVTFEIQFFLGSAQNYKSFMSLIHLPGSTRNPSFIFPGRLATSMQFGSLKPTSLVVALTTHLPANTLSFAHRFGLCGYQTRVLTIYPAQLIPLMSSPKLVNHELDPLTNAMCLSYRSRSCGLFNLRLNGTVTTCSRCAFVGHHACVQSYMENHKFCKNCHKQWHVLSIPFQGKYRKFYGILINFNYLVYFKPPVMHFHPVDNHHRS